MFRQLLIFLVFPIFRCGENFKPPRSKVAQGFGERVCLILAFAPYFKPAPAALLPAGLPYCSPSLRLGTLLGLVDRFTLGLGAGLLYPGGMPSSRHVRNNLMWRSVELMYTFWKPEARDPHLAAWHTWTSFKLPGASQRGL